MDDFATVIWVVIIAGAMIFNVVSQSRKARGKGARTPGHEEAWPSQAHPESEPDPMPAPRPAPWPVAPVFPDECQSLEEIPAEEYAPEHTTPKAAGRGHLRHQTVNRLMDDSGCGNNVPDRRIQPPAGDYLLGNTETQVRGIRCLKPSLKPS